MVVTERRSGRQPKELEPRAGNRALFDMVIPGVISEDMYRLRTDFRIYKRELKAGLNIRRSEFYGRRIDDISEIFIENTRQMERKGISYPDGVRNTFDEVFGHEAKPEAVVDLWENFAFSILTSKKEEGVAWDKDGVITTEEFITSYLERYLKTYWSSKGKSEEAEGLKLLFKVRKCVNSIDVGYWPFVKIGSGFEPLDLNILYCLAAKYFLKKGELPQDISRRMVPVLSYMAEEVLWNQKEAKFREFILQIGDKYKAKQGFRIAGAVIDDLFRLYGERHREFFKGVKKALRRDHPDFNYKVRPVTVPYKARQVIIPQDVFIDNLNDPVRFYEEAFSKSGASDDIKRFFIRHRSKPMEIIERAVSSRRKTEAGIVLMIADIFGVDPKIAARIAAATQILWAGFIFADDVIDLHQVRDGEAALHRMQGKASAMQEAMLSIFTAVNSVVGSSLSDRRLANSFTKMSMAVYEGDLTERGICWDEVRSRFRWDYDIEEYRKAVGKIASIFSWFTRYAGRDLEKAGYSGFAEIGNHFGRFTKDLGHLVLDLNDLEDIASDKPKHELGNDIGQKISMPWWQFMHLKLLEDDLLVNILEKDKTAVREFFDEIAEKRRNGIKLDDVEIAKLQEIVAIGQKYLSRIVNSLLPAMNSYYEQAKGSLNIAFSLLPKDESGKLDERNQLCHSFLENYLEYIWKKIQGYKEYKHVVTEVREEDRFRDRVN